jgi:DNA modification methylase
MSNESLIFDTHLKIDNLDLMDPDAVWPMNVEICITKFPIRKRDGYSSDLLKKFAAKLKSSMVKNGKAFIICYAPSECKHRPFEVAKEMVDVGFTHVDNIVVEKTWIPGKRSENMLVNSHEYVLFFVNGDTWKVDRSPIKYYLQQEEDTPCCGNSWLVESGSLDEAYSDDLAELLLRFSDLLPGSSVFDPFMGNNGIVKACLKLGHSFTGFETSLRKIEQYKKIVNEYRNKN